MNPPFVSIPERTSAMLHMIMELAITMEYVIPLTIENNMIKVEYDKIFKFSKQLNRIKRTQKDVAFADMIRSEFHSCVWRMELKIEVKDGGFLWWLLRDWMMHVFVIRRKEKVKGRSRIDVVMVWESLRLKMEKN